MGLRGFIMTQHFQAERVTLLPSWALCALVVLACLFGAAPARAGEARSQLRPALGWTNTIPNDFVKEGRIRLYFTNDGFAFDA